MDHKQEVSFLLNKLEKRNDCLELIRYGENAVYYHKSSSWIIRISRETAKVSQLNKEIKVAEHLINSKIPSVQPVFDSIIQPIKAYKCLATIWKYVETNSSKPFSHYEFGRLLRRIQSSLSNVSFKLPKYDPLKRSRKRLEILENLNREDIEDIKWLMKRTYDLEKKQKKFISELGVGPIHGDYHKGNVLNTIQGLVVHDFEEVSIGPREWDIVATAIAVRRFGLDKYDFEKFKEGYDCFNISLDHLEDLCDIRELFMVCWLLQNRYTSEAVNTEVTHRINSLRTRKIIPWNPF